MLAATESPHFFIGAKGGHQWASDETYRHEDPRGAIWGLYSGLQISPAWSWGGGYQYHGNLKADATSVNVKTWLIESSFRYDWYLKNNLSLYSRLGIAYWDMEKTQFSSDKLYATGFSPLGEVGVNYNLTSSVLLSVGYQYIDSIGNSSTGKYDSHAALINLTYIFGRTTQPIVVDAIKRAPAVERVP
ncbi:outer membrane beta-barrel protein [Aeromonas veronii]|nr:outer membrane beta-barrel protein [Aeromonas veronii]MBJ7583908.1 outer membrane beta-barrel protein [Aeromonas veronii]WOE87231.1 outer membrane beta-barrel protein [Aeromonas veronii]